MIANIAANMANHFSSKGVFKREDVQVYSYGFELLLSTILNGIGIFLIAVFMGIFYESILFVVAFITLRVTAGGYHAKHHWSCFLTVNISFLLFAVMLRFMSVNIMLPYTIFTVAVSALIIWIFSPVEAENKPMSERKKKRLRDRSLVIATINMAAVIIFIFIPKLPIALIAYYISGAFVASLSLIAALIFTKKENSNL